MNEKLIERKLREAVSKMGGTAMKFYSAYHTGVPDRLVLMPGGRASFVELKSTGKKPTKLQEHCHAKLRGMGFEVAVIDTQEGLDEYLHRLEDTKGWIDIKERLPEKGEEVLVATRNGKITKSTYVRESHWGPEWKGSGTFSRGVTHWMAMPPVPTREEVSDERK